MDDLKICLAKPDDEGQIRNLLAMSKLPNEDIHEHLPNFLIARQNNSIVGAVGLEKHDRVGLLRSLVVASTSEGKGIGRMLCDRMIAYARLNGVREIYLLTITAEGLFRKLGFTVVDRDTLPESIKKTNEFRTLCPVSAVCMTKRIDSETFHAPKELLNLKPGVPKVKMWAVALDKTMFTYFEIEPEARFEKHKHESEQITYVLEGELFFEIDDKTVCVKAGDVIAIPSNVPHGAYTMDRGVRAVDAWSPVRHEYL